MRKNNGTSFSSEGPVDEMPPDALQQIKVHLELSDLADPPYDLDRRRRIERIREDLD